MNKLGKAALALIAVSTASRYSLAQVTAKPIKNIVLVHGAWVDGSGWKPVYEILVRDGFEATLVQEPLTSFADDVAATKRVLQQQSGPCILVGHSYGGSVVTEAGLDSHVVALVYIAAHMPDAGENETEDGKRYPSDLASVNAIRKSTDGFTYLDPSLFAQYFAADLPAMQAQFEARSQIETAGTVFTGESPPQLGERSQAGCWSQEQTESSTPNWSVGTLNGHTAMWSR